MTTIDRTRPVMVTGANGYVASWLVKRLLDDGLTVHAAVRNPNDEKKIAHLKEAAAKSSGQIKFFAGDLLKPGSYKAAMEGCELVYHTASPFTTTVKDPQKELIDPAVKGTENVLRSATEVDSVKRVVVTSSCAAIYGDAIDTVNAPGGKLTEEIWNTTSSLEYQPYSFSKTLAEKKAWELAKSQDKWDLVTVNMSLVMGPALNPGNTTSESINILKMLGGGEMKMGAPRMGVGLVDVRDVAEAHFKAGFTPTAKGRYITSAHSTDLLEMGKVLLPKYGDRFPLPTKALPKWLLMIIGPFTSKLFTRPFIRKNVDVPWNADNSKIKKELGMTFRPMKETMEDSFQNLIDEGILKAK
ncbi:MAG: NAD-dependent epimerase/dehydratase family protein [Flavobacteriales bacterium]|nr:NAD-dependent epimerase/dehydratase family protein [Flavobacteriales bacterium]MBK7240193.1 NAD-dependent epimerase/dehydratase family protein [Flavobacteriales bacterium]MBP9136946.1 NAD-dependent epimerase/dehydratase family protein [Flavobacteriales bacterium]HQV52619.1 NAD-dependent epimerase/dehydratase family protein [Flavobacteriales bacterium]HQX31205.1 NAD-dependent epimerase/dehydratase family protein [Flavobacteriales bacterium]